MTNALVSTVGDVAQLGERWLCKPEVAGSIPVVSTGKALLANTAGKAFFLGFRQLSSVVRLAVRSSSSPDEMTANDTDCPGLPEFGATTGATKLTGCLRGGIASVLFVPVARTAARSVDGDASRSSDGNESNAP